MITMPGRNIDTLILSDLHLGSEASRAAEATDLIESIDFRRLILLGDIFSDLNFSRLTREHWSFLSAVRRLSNPRRKRQIVWVEGNHDAGLATLMSHLVGIPVYERYVWDYSGKRHMAVHGHQFDRFVSKNYLISRLGVSIYEHLQKYDTRNKTFSNKLDRLSTKWLRLSDKVANGALAYARHGGAQRIFCGHTHAPITRHRHGIDYYNTGCWVEQLPTYITIHDQGVDLHEYRSVVPSRTPSGTRHRHTGEERRDVSAEASCLFDQAGLPPVRAYESLRR